MGFDRHTPEIRTLIVSRPDRIGDVVISTSCLAPIRENFPRAKIYFVAAERMRPLLEGHPLLEGFISLDADLDAEFQRLHADVIVHLHPDKRCYAAAKRAGIPLRIGYSVRFQNRQLTHAIPERRKEGLLHEAEYNFDLLQVLGVPLPETLKPCIHLSQSYRESLRGKLPWKLESTRFAVLNPTAHSPFARWPMASFLELGERLKCELDLLPVYISDVSLPCPASAGLNLTGQTDLGELGWLMKHAAVTITNDSGPSHLAAAVNCPVVTLFGRHAPLYGPTRWGPLSEKAVILAKPLPPRPLEHRTKHWRRCFAAISVDEVLAATRTILVV